VQSEKRDASQLNVPLTASHPVFVLSAPNSVTGSFGDHIAVRGAAFPLWIAVSANTWREIVEARKSSSSLTPPTSMHLCRLRQAEMMPHWGRQQKSDDRPAEAARIVRHSPIVPNRLVRGRHPKMTVPVRRLATRHLTRSRMSGRVQVWLRRSSIVTKPR